MTKRILSIAAAMAVVTMFAANASAQEPLGNYLFNQYSTYGANQVNASMYPAPHPVPHYVGGSMYTYQPLMPHEMMYTHTRNYYNFTGGPDQYYRDPYCARSHQGGGSLNITRVRWQNGYSAVTPLPFNSAPLAGLQYRFAKRKYGLGHAGGCASGNCGGAVTGGCASGNCGANASAAGVTTQK